MPTLNEQQEFMRLGRALREHGLDDETLRQELGYEDVDAVRTAVQSGRVTLARLERLRELANNRMPTLVQEKQAQAAQATETRMDSLFERLQREVKTAATPEESGAPGQPAGGPAPVSAAPARRAHKRAPRTRGRKRQPLTAKQHERLRDQVEHLWAVDKRFRNWSLLARVMGLATGQAAKRAYDVGSSLTTLQHVETFARLHAGFGSKATTALKAGIEIGELQTHLLGARNAPAEAAAEAGAEARTAAPARESAVDRTTALSTLPDVPPHVDFESLVELGSAIDIEVKRMFHQSRFFDGVSRLATLPGTVRWNAAQTRDRLQEALRFFGGEEPASPEGSGTDEETAVTES
ncbi:MAG TPA: hypothetical protein VMN60_08735 [Longimicrobiales bacterium]|nr:hypothetical protein [Longimicrobiales bacterium]